jgi:hypothetical protein
MYVDEHCSLNMTLDKLEKQQRFSSILVRDVLTDLIHKAKVAKAGPKSVYYSIII